MIKYNKAISNINVNDEMKNRILQNVVNNYKNNNETQKIIPFKKLGALLIAAILIVTACVGGMFTGDMAANDEYVEYSNIEELNKEFRFDIRESSHIPLDNYDVTYANCFGIAEITYSNHIDSICVRIAKSNDDVSGDYNEYSTLKEMTLKKYNVVIKCNDDGCHLLTASKGKMKYAISSTKGLSETEITAIINDLII